MHSGSVKTCQFWLIKGAHSGALPSRVGPANVCSNSSVNLKLFTPESQLAWCQNVQAYVDSCLVSGGFSQ